MMIVVPFRFGKSVIKSAVKLAYEHAQDMLDQPDKDWTAEELPEIHAPWTAKIISEKVNFLQSLALKLRAKRVENGALRLDQPKLCFSLDKESGLPQGYRVYEQRHSNRLIEEFKNERHIIFKVFFHAPIQYNFHDALIPFISYNILIPPAPCCNQKFF